ncbi:MAG: hypothetical protein KF724_08245 [Phycisphaeraceae bacterium]|nr:hypothetical protein [Phycisphaeraceae bacterium]
MPDWLGGSVYSWSSSQGSGQSLPLACGDWASTKAAYRFLDNKRVSEAEILAGHMQATRACRQLVDGRVLALHDTTEFSFTVSEHFRDWCHNRVAMSHKDERGSPANAHCLRHPHALESHRHH